MSARSKSKAAEPVRILGVLDRAKDDVYRMIGDLKDVSGEREIVIDFSACTVVSVEGLEWLEELVIRAESSEVRVRFENIPPTIYKVFKVSHIDSILRACGAPSVTVGPTC